MEEGAIFLRSTLRAIALVLVALVVAQFLTRPSANAADAAATDVVLAPGTTTTGHSEPSPDSSSDDRDWRLAVDLDGDAPLKVHTRVRRGELSFRFEATLDAGVATIISLCRETDLMPTWNPYCKEAGVAKLASPTDLWAYADFKYSPLPIPPMFVVVHATLDDRTRSAGHWHVRVASSPPTGGGADALDRAALSAEMLKHGEVHLKYAFGTLAAVPPRTAAGAARTRVFAELAMDLSRLEVLGPIRFLTPPAWLVNLITKIMIPSIWKACLEAIARIQADGADGPIGARLAADSTGVYRRIRRATKQPS